MQEIKAKLAAYLVMSEKTKDDVAKELGINRRTLQNKLDGHSDFKLSEAVTLAGLLGCSVNDLATSLTKEE